MKKITALRHLTLAAALAAGLVGCESSPSITGTPNKEPALAAAAAAEPTFITEMEDGRLWVFRGDKKPEKSEKHVTLIGAGPGGVTLKSPDRETLMAYLTHKPGFQTELEDGRLWVFKAGAKKEKSEKHVTLIGAGPQKMTIKAPDMETAMAYVVAAPGFVTELEDGRVWVFRKGAAVPAEKPEKHITLVGAGPRGMTLKGLDRDTLDAYRSALPR